MRIIEEEDRAALTAGPPLTQPALPMLNVVLLGQFQNSDPTRCAPSSLGQQLSMSRYLKPGTLVRRVNHPGDSWEDGIVVHCWHEDELGMFDCYVAFFGASIPEGRPSEKPYIMRYASTSLTEIEPNPRQDVGFELVMGSDVADRDGMYLELNDGSVEAMPLAEVFYSDIDGSMSASTFGNSLPLDAIEWMVAEAKRRLPPKK